MIRDLKDNIIKKNIYIYYYSNNNNSFLEILRIIK